ncbi:S1C family serine protease [Salinicoccus carnicancri]|uniref:S1C family serine protease n=1 Tax=Salinicoccus carnicancri TaxID=558170 RepID=UPI0002EB9D95|nr:S1C family serine protease [Salinicoccus carnicancri]
MDKGEKHIIPREQYRRKRRVFSSEDSGSRREFAPDSARQQAERQQEAERTREFQNGPEARRASSGGHPPESHTDPGLNPDQNPAPAAAEDSGRGAGTDPAENAAPTPAPNQPAGEQKEDAAPERDHHPGGGGSTGPDEPDSRGGPPGDDGGRKGRGCLFWLVPLIMGAIGALAMLLLFSVFGNDDEGTGIQEGEETAVESDQEAVPEDARNELEDIKQQLEENSGNSAEGITDTTAAIQKAKKSVVSVINLQKAESFMPGTVESPEAEPEEAGTGSGVIYKLTDDKAYIVTNNHVVEGAEELQINLESGEQLTASIVGADVWTDLAVLEVDRGDIGSAIEFADSDELLVGETAIAIGSPLGEAFSGSVSRGIVSGLDRSVPVDIDGDGNYDWESNVIQTDAAINPGNSGGALVNASGNLIGINSMKISMPTVEGIGFAIPANEVREIVTQLEENGEVTRPYLGIQLQDLYTVPTEILTSEMNLPEDVTEGVIVSNVQQGTPAADGGLEQYDVIVSLDGEPIRNMLELRQYLYYEKEQGEEMTVEFYRNGESRETTVTLE